MTSRQWREVSENTTTVTLERVTLSVEAALSHEILLDARCEYLVDWLVKRARVQIRGYLWGKTVESHHIEYPADWWSAFKVRWFPGWWLNRWPAEMKAIDLNLKAIWPTLRYLVPSHEPRLVLTSFGSSLGNYPDGEPPQ